MGYHNWRIECAPARDRTRDLCVDRLSKKHNRKSSIKPPGGLFNFGPCGGGLNREGGLLEGGFFTKSNDKDIFGSFSVLLSHNLRNQNTIFLLKYINSTQFLSQTISKVTCKVVLQNKWKYLVNSRTLHKWGGGA